MVEWDRILYAIFMGAVFGFAIAKLVDPPPPPEIVESVAKSEWARAWAEKFCAETVPPEKREECIRELSRKVAERFAARLFA